jgi:UPF0176 protein
MRTPVVVAALYKFAPLPDFRELRPDLLATCEQAGVLGTLLLAPEGVNGTIAGTAAGIGRVLDHLRSDHRLADLEHKESRASRMPFYRMKVRLKSEIVTLGVPAVDPLVAVGEYVPPAEWNDLIQDPGVLVLDTRNHYEYRIGTFQGAQNPNLRSFREFSEYVSRELDPRHHRRIAMFCTGGIRCEKATALLLRQGFRDVYHLRGGILKYLEEIPPGESLWHGECFVFDQRVALGHGLQEGDYELCHNCRMPVSAAQRSSSHYQEGVSCPQCFHELTEARRARLEERQRQMLLARMRSTTHLGQPTDNSGT